MQSRHLQQIALSLAMTACLGGVAQAQPARAARKFAIVEATIADIHKAIRSKQLTATQLVNMYLARIKAYNGTCVNEPQGILGPVSPIPHAGALNALMTLNLRPAARKKWGFDDRKARRIAADRGLNVIGTLGILTTGAEKGLITLSDALDDLKQTSFRASHRLLELLVQQERE